MKYFNIERYQKSISEIDSSEYHELNDVNLINDMFTTKFLEVLDKEAPLTVIQPRKKYSNWISEATKDKMKVRDLDRDKAKKPSTAS